MYFLSDRFWNSALLRFPNVYVVSSSQIRTTSLRRTCTRARLLRHYDDAITHAHHDVGASSACPCARCTCAFRAPDKTFRSSPTRRQRVHARRARVARGEREKRRRRADCERTKLLCPSCVGNDPSSSLQQLIKFIARDLLTLETVTLECCSHSHDSVLKHVRSDISCPEDVTFGLSSNLVPSPRHEHGSVPPARLHCPVHVLTLIVIVV